MINNIMKNMEELGEARLLIAEGQMLIGRELSEWAAKKLGKPSFPHKAEQEISTYTTEALKQLYYGHYGFSNDSTIALGSEMFYPNEILGEINWRDRIGVIKLVLQAVVGALLGWTASSLF
jgi:hypothetical protein